VNGKPSTAEQLKTLRDLEQGFASLDVQSPAVLLVSAPGPISDKVVEWLMVILDDKSGGGGGGALLWKLSVISSACTHFYFTWEQAIEVGGVNQLPLATIQSCQGSSLRRNACVYPAWDLA